MAQLLGSDNGTDFGPDPRTQTVHLNSFVKSSVLQILHLYLQARVCMRIRTRAYTRVVRQRVDTFARACASARAAWDTPQHRQLAQRACD